MPHPFALVEATSYHLPEGRYYAAPLMLKPRRQNRCTMPAMLALGLSLASVSSLQQQSREPLIAAATTVLTRSDGLLASAMLVGAVPAVTQANSPATAEKTGRHAVLPDEERINSHEKTVAVIRRKSNSRPLLTHYGADRIFAAVPQPKPDVKHVARLVVPQEARTRFQISRALLPAPQKKMRPQLPVPKMLASLVTNDRPDILALGYAPADISRMGESPFDSILNDDEKKTGGRFIPPIGPKDHAWAATPVPASTFSAPQQKCLAEAIYFEARGESLKGQAAVAQVVLNRVRNPAYPDTVCGVVYQNVNWYNRCQFSFACDGRRHRVTERRHWRIAQDIAKAVTAGQIWLPEVGSSTHYHALYVHPRWAYTMDKVQKIGLHIFYRTRGGGWI